MGVGSHRLDETMAEYTVKLALPIPKEVYAQVILAVEEAVFIIVKT